MDFVILQNTDGAEIMGYYITNSGDTVRITLEVPLDIILQKPEIEKMQIAIRYYDSKGEKRKLNPEMVREVSFNYNEYNYRMLSRYDNLNLTGSYSKNNYIFLLIIKDGPLKLFYFYKKGPEPGSGGYGPSYAHTDALSILQKEDDALFKVTNSFKKEMCAYLNDCPALAIKIENKIYKSRDIIQIVDEYNGSCR
jgi:hypothetical protein